MTATFTRSPRGSRVDMVNMTRNPQVQNDSAGWTPTWFGQGATGTDTRLTTATWLRALGMSASTAMQKTWASVPTIWNDTGWRYFFDQWYAAQTYTCSAWLVAPQRSASFRAMLQFYDSQSNLLGTVISDPSPIVPANTPTRVQLTATAPANTTFANFTFGHSGTQWTPQVNDTLVGFGIQRTAGSELWFYFDGSTPTGANGAFAWEGTAGSSYSDHIVPDWTTQLTPELLLIAKTDRAVRNVLHDIVGRADPDVSLKPAGLRTGTLSLLFNGEQAARDADLAFAGLGTWTLVDTEQATRSMKFALAPTGSLHLEQIEDLDTSWRLDVPFQELPQ